MRRSTLLRCQRKGIACSLVAATACVWAACAGCTPEAMEQWAAMSKPPAPTPSAQEQPQLVREAPKPRISPETHYASGAMLERSGDLAGAVEQYEKAIAASPMLAKGYNRLGIVYVKMHRFGEAETILLQGMRVEPASAQIRNNLGYCYLLQEKFGPAEEQFRAALNLSPNFTRARMNLGVALARTMQLRESVAEFSKIVPASIAYYNVALLCTEMKEYIQAEGALRESLRINPDYAPAREQLTEISALARQMRRQSPGERSIDDQLAGNPPDDPVSP